MNNTARISQFTFEQDFIDTFIRLKLYFIFQIKSKKISREEFDNIFSKILNIISSKFIYYDPFDKDLFTKIDNYIEKSVDFYIEDELLRKSLQNAAYLIYTRRKIRALNNLINRIEFNLATKTLKNIKIKFSTILRNIYPIYIGSSHFKTSKNVSLNMLFDDEIIINFQSDMKNEFIINKIEYIITHLGYINRDIVSVIDFYKLNSFDSKNLLSFTENLLNFGLKVINKKAIDEINIYVGEYITLLVIDIIHNIFDKIKNNEQDS